MVLLSQHLILAIFAISQNFGKSQIHFCLLKGLKTVILGLFSQFSFRQICEFMVFYKIANISCSKMWNDFKLICDYIGAPKSVWT